MSFTHFRTCFRLDLPLSWLVNLQMMHALSRDEALDLFRKVKYSITTFLTGGYAALTTRENCHHIM